MDSAIVQDYFSFNLFGTIPSYLYYTIVIWLVKPFWIEPPKLGPYALVILLHVL